MGDEEWFPPGEAAMGRGEDEPAPAATVWIGDEVLRARKEADIQSRSCFFRLKAWFFRVHPEGLVKTSK